MRWTHQYSPLDQTVDALNLLAAQMRRAAAHGDELTVDDFRAVLDFVEQLIDHLAPLQELTIQEQR